MKEQVKQLYEQLMYAWNVRNAEQMAQLFTLDGELIGFDGSVVIGNTSIFEHLQPIFASHPTPPFTFVVQHIRLISDDIAIVHAVAGMKSEHESTLNPSLHTIHSLVARNTANGWLIELFQNTPAQFHGRPELVEQLTIELTVNGITPLK